jgi:hypothetical protein
VPLGRRGADDPITQDVLAGVVEQDDEQDDEQSADEVS